MNKETALDRLEANVAAAQRGYGPPLHSAGPWEPERYDPDPPDPGAVQFRLGAWAAAKADIARWPQVKGNIPDRAERELDRTLQQLAVLSVRADKLATGR